MMGGRASTIIFYGFAAFCAALFALYYLEMFAGWDGWCAADESVAVCRREWVGTVGGYLAAIAASITIIVLLQQTTSLRQQTEFVVGNADPAAHITRIPPPLTGANALDNRLRIVNWNRNPILVSRVELVEPSNFELYRIERSDRGYPGTETRDHIRQGRVIIPGREAQTPHVLELDLNVIDLENDRPIGDAARMVFEVELVVLDARHRKVCLTIETDDGVIV